MILCIKAICPAGPPKLRKPIRIQTASASLKAISRNFCSLMVVVVPCSSVNAMSYSRYQDPSGRFFIHKWLYQ